MAYLGRKGATAPLASADLPTNSISTDHLIANSVTSAKIGVDVIVAEDLANNSVTVAELADNAVDTNAILDDAITGAKLANDIAISTTGSITTTGAFTSAGIDDNANAQVLFIDSSENLGIGVTPVAWHADYSGLHLGATASFAANNDAGSNFLIGNNTYYDNTGYNRLISDKASLFRQNNGEHYFSVAGTGDADSVITWTTAMTIDNSGKVGIGEDAPIATLEIKIDNSVYPVEGGLDTDGIHIHNTGGLNAYSTLKFTGADNHWDNCMAGIYTQFTNVTENFEEAEMHLFTTYQEEVVEAIYIARNGNVGIGVGLTRPTAAKLEVNGDLHVGLATASSPTIKLQSSGTGYRQFHIKVDDSNSVTKLDSTFSTGSAYPISFQIGGTEKVRIDTSGNVGINDIDPSEAKLSIVGASSPAWGQIIQAYSSGHGLKILAPSTSAAGGLRVMNQAGDTDYFMVRGDGKVGIGETAPVSKLHVQDDYDGGGDGMVHFQSSGNECGVTWETTANTARKIKWGVASNGKFNVYDETNSILCFFIATSGLVQGDFNDTSDEALKENIQLLDSGALSKINLLRPVSFDWKIKDKGSSVGFIAQEVEKIFPSEVVGENYVKDQVTEATYYTNSDVLPEGKQVGDIKTEAFTTAGNGGKAINTTGIVAHLTKAVQELSAKVTALESA